MHKEGDTMGKYLKDKKIIIYRQEGSSGGFSPAKYRPIHGGKLWAYARQLSAKEFWEASRQNYQEERYFAINWRNDVKPGMLVFYQNTWYEIVRVDPFEDYKDDKSCAEAIYKIAEENGIEGKALFRAAYQALIGKDQGPRLANFLRSIDKKRLLEILSEY